MLCGSLDGRGGLGEKEYMSVYVWVSPFVVYLKLSQHCSSAIPQYKIKNSKEKKIEQYCILKGLTAGSYCRA